MEAETNRQESAAASATRTYLSLREAAGRAGISFNTLRNWVTTGKVKEGQGLCHVGGKRVIDWMLFEATMIRRG